MPLFGAQKKLRRLWSAEFFLSRSWRCLWDVLLAQARIVIRVVLLLEGNRNVDVGPVGAALEVRSVRENRIDRSTILPDQAPHVAKPVRGEVQPVRPFLEELILLCRGRDLQRQRRQGIRRVSAQRQ